MEKGLDRHGLDSRVFEAFSETSRRRYLYLCNLETNVSRWSRSAVDYFGLPGEYMLGADAIWEEHIHPEDRHLYRKDIDAVFSGQKKFHDVEYRARTKNGDYVICVCRGKIMPGENGEPDLFAGTLTNYGIADTVDATTSLYNIHVFQNSMRTMKKTGIRAAVLMIGVNQFNQVNGVHGYNFGNKVLYRMAEEIRSLVGERGMVYRLDGAKFAVCIRGGGRKEAEQLSAEIRRVSREKIQVEEEHVTLDISCGAVLLDGTELGEYSVHAAAAYALEQSKREEMGELVFFNAKSHAADTEKMAMMDTIRHCITRNFQGFYLCYQPLVSEPSGEIIGAEALLRWEHEQYGEVLPGRFIAWLENEPVFSELGHWIIRQALHDMKAIVKKKPGFLIHINVAYSQLVRSNFCEEVQELLEEQEFPVENLVLELTERCRIMNQDELITVINYLRGIGIKIALDDFGTGYASLDVVRRVPVEILKIDRSFISQIRDSEMDQAITRAIIECAHRTGRKVCIEGIENRDMYEYLKEYGADFYQGYYYSRPVKIEYFLEKLW